jgi:hypothetical protein
MNWLVLTEVDMRYMVVSVITVLGAAFPNAPAFAQSPVVALIGRAGPCRRASPRQR